MKVIIPMAGVGSRLRPHTLTTPKPFIPIAGKPIIERLLSDIILLLKDIKIDSFCFIIKDNDKEARKLVEQIGKKLSIKIDFFIQKKPLGTAHALFCAREAMEGPIMIAFSDTLFKMNFKLDISASEGAIWVKKIQDPASFGVVKVNKGGYIIDIKEKPKVFFSDLAIIGIYYFKDGRILSQELESAFHIDEKEEYQLTTVLGGLIKKGLKLSCLKVEEWMDCGNKSAILKANNKLLKWEQVNKNYIHPKAKIKNSLLIGPCFVGENTLIENSKIGPFVSIGRETKIKNSNISYSLIQDETLIAQANLSNSMIGNRATCIDISREISLGDYSVVAF